MSDQRQGGISWTDETWNVVRGCSRASEGCANCYAERQAIRMGGEGEAYDGLVQMTRNGPRWTGKVVLVEELLDQPARWKRPRSIFVNAMSDLFHEELPDEAIFRVFKAMANAPQHRFQVLTKRSKRMRELMPAIRARLVDRLRHVWLGVSVENQEAADARIPDLVATPAELRWLSVEPLLGPVDLRRWLDPIAIAEAIDHHHATGHSTGGAGLEASCDTCGVAWETGKSEIAWVVVGGESGPRARPMHPQWARDVRDACATTGVPFHFKQHGAWSPRPINELPAGRAFKTIEVDGELLRFVGKTLGGRSLDGRVHDDFPADKLELSRAPCRL